jgi:tetratricopeptide (TPR) repeat protein
MALLNRPADVEQVWLSLLNHDPASTDGTLGLARVFMHQKRYNEAILLLKQASHAKNASPYIQAALGTDELEAGQKDAGIADLQAMMRTSQDPGTVNDIAYILTDHDADLPEAAQYAAKALQQIEKSTADIQLANISQKDLAQISLLGATWDTVGWIDFKQAKYFDAERYIRAAWLLGQHPAVADHLRQVYEKESKLTEARHMQKIAAAIRPAPQLSASQVPTPISHEDRATKEKYLLEVQKLRTAEISGLPKKMASAQFWMVFTPQGVEEVKMITGDPSLSRAADLLKKHAYPQTFPNPGPVKIVRRGILTCSQFDPTCQLVLMEPQ